MNYKKIKANNVKILVCCHKPCDLPNNPDGIFVPIQVGAAISNWKSTIQRDDQLEGRQCENISSKNKSYCELTAMYWAWKNLRKIYPDTEYIGLFHYRRYFSFSFRNYFTDLIFREEKEVNNYRIDLPKLQKILSYSEVILSRRKLYPYSLEIDYCVCHISDDVKTLQKVVHDLYPDYDIDMYKIFVCNNKLSPYNIFLLEWNNFDKYCLWLFSILEECERRIDISAYTDVQKRIWGFMGERLLNVWVHHNLKRISFLNILKYDSSAKGHSLILYGMDKLRKNCSFLFGRSYNINFKKYLYILDGAKVE